MITQHILSYLIITCPLFKLEHVLCFFCLSSFHFLIFLHIFLFFQFLVFSVFFSSLFFFSCYFNFSLFVVFSSEEAASMSAVRQLSGRPTPRSMSGASPNSSIRCNTWCESSSVLQCASPCAPLSSTSATTRMLTVLLPCLAVDGSGVREQGPVNRVKLN